MHMINSFHLQQLSKLNEGIRSKLKNEESAMIKVLIADDHAVVRRGIKQIISETSDMIISGEASNGLELLNKVKKGTYDVLVLDISMPGKGGLDVMRELKTLKPRLPVLVLSIHPEEQYAVRLLKAGASGYLSKDRAPDELVSALRKISQGKKYITSIVAEKLASDLEIDSKKPLHEHLSDREFQIMCLIASGKTVKEIAYELFLSVKTISTYRSRVMEKMRMRTNAQLTHYAVKNGLVD